MKTLTIAAALLALAVAPQASAARSVPAHDMHVLVATVGPGYTITLQDHHGGRVTGIEAGTYTIIVNDRSSEHDFALAGPGVKKTSGVKATGTNAWKLKLTKGVYKYVCTPHLAFMKGQFTVS